MNSAKRPPQNDTVTPEQEREVVAEAVSLTCPWTLAVTFAEAKDYQEAQRLTMEILFSPEEWKLHPIDVYQPKDRRIKIGGQRRDLIGPMAFYVGGWESAQIELRPTTSQDA